MNTQNTPVHVKLWHKDFWRMSLANMLLTMSVYTLIPILPLWMIYQEHFSSMQVGVSMGVFSAGLFLFGGICSFLVQRFRRNVVCLLSVLGVLCCTALLYYIERFSSLKLDFILIVLIRFFQGAFYGLAQMVLSSTLIIDTSESFQRTEANHSSSWFGRFALSLGPLLSLFVLQCSGFNWGLLSSIICGLVAELLIMRVKFPFRIPEEDTKVISSDRFFLPQGKWLFVNLVITTCVIGLLLSTRLSFVFYGMIMGGFLLALLAQKFVFVQAELESEVITGLILMSVAILMMLTRHQMIVYYLSPLFIGLGIGIIGSRFLLFFIKLSHHCQRGTSQSTFLLGWEGGIGIGLFIGYAFMYDQPRLLYVISILLLLLSFLTYHFFTHKWFMKHKNR
jgi:MFS family permease